MQDVRVDQSFMDRLLNLGTIAIETAGEASGLTMAGVEDPQEVADSHFRGRSQIHMSDKKLQGRIALVTGASKGLGKAMSIALAEAGAQTRVGISRRRETRGHGC